MSDHYWSYDVDGGMQWHDTAEEAERAADDRLTIYRDEADSDGEWPDDVECICWGRVLGHVVETTGMTEEFSEVREWVDYHLAPVEETSERAVRLGCAGDGSPAGDLAAALDEVERLRLVVATLDEIRDEVLHGGPVMRTPNEVLDLIDRATAHLEDTHG